MSEPRSEHAPPPVRCIECDQAVEQMAVTQHTPRPRHVVYATTNHPCGHKAGVVFDFTAAQSGMSGGPDE